MKKTITFIFALFYFTILLAHSQKPDTITLGVRYLVENNEIKKETKHADNLYYLFEFDFLKMFETYLKDNKKDYVIRYRQIEQGEKLNYLNDGIVDAIIYGVSITEDRSKDYLFSIPYFSNSSIVLASKNSKITPLDLSKGVTRIGYVRNTTSGKELDALSKSKPNKVKIKDYNNFNQLLEALERDEIDAIAGDRSLLSSYFLNGKLYFKGDLPTTRAQIGDFYAVISKKENTGIIGVFNQFIRKNAIQINELRNKYFGIIENKLMQHKPVNIISYKNVAIGIGVTVLLFVFTIWYFLKRLKIVQSEKEAIQKKYMVDETKEQLSNILESAFTKFRDKLDSEEIANIGIEFFNTAKKQIIYVGSGGFLADEIYGEKWKQSIHNALKRGVLLDRIVDLPNIDFNKLQFENMDYFHPESYDRMYVQKYLKWLLLQYIDFVNYGDNFKIHNSRGASLWGYGLVIIIKDRTEVLLFTTNKEKKIGSVIVNQELATHFSELMEIIKNIGKEIDEHDLEREFFATENNLKKLINDFKNEVQENSYINFSKEISDKVDSLSQTINKRFIELNNRR